MSISMNLHDCLANEKPRAALAEQIADWERRNGPVTTTPPLRRAPDTRVDRVINAKSFETGKKADGKHNERNAAKLSLPVVKPDHDHPITLIMLTHAFRKLKVKKVDVARHLGRSPSYISNACNGKNAASESVLREVLTAVWKLTEIEK